MANHKSNKNRKVKQIWLSEESRNIYNTLTNLGIKVPLLIEDYLLELGQKYIKNL